MDKFNNPNSRNYQTIPPTTVMMAGNNKELSPMRVDDNIHATNTNVGEAQASGDNPIMLDDFRQSVEGSGPDIFRFGKEASELGSFDEAAVSAEANPIPEKKPGSNVIVDESPLQLQMEKNKECKLTVATVII